MSGIGGKEQESTCDGSVAAGCGSANKICCSMCSKNIDNVTDDAKILCSACYENNETLLLSQSNTASSGRRTVSMAVESTRFKKDQVNKPTQVDDKTDTHYTYLSTSKDNDGFVHTRGLAELKERCDEAHMKIAELMREADDSERRNEVTRKSQADRSTSLYDLLNNLNNIVERLAERVDKLQANVREGAQEDKETEKQALERERQALQSSKEELESEKRQLESERRALDNERRLHEKIFALEETVRKLTNDLEVIKKKDSGSVQVQETKDMSGQSIRIHAGVSVESMRLMEKDLLEE